PGRKVLVSPEWIQRVSWEESKVYVDLSKRHIEAAPEFDPSIPLAREHEERLYTHLGRAKYWEWEPRAPEGKANGKTRGRGSGRDRAGRGIYALVRVRVRELL